MPHAPGSPRWFVATVGVVALGAVLAGPTPPSAASAASGAPAAPAAAGASGSGAAVVPGSGVNPLSLTAVGSKLFYTATDAAHGRELWATDGTSAGTHLVRDVRPGAASSNPIGLTASGTSLYFTADDGTHGRELWTSDGTAAGTKLVADLRPGAASSTPTSIDGAGYFAADDGVHGRELWFTDGTAAGTRLIADLRPGAAGSNPDQVVDYGGVVVFVADDGVHGREPWQYLPGSATPDVPTVFDLRPGAASSNPLNLVAKAIYGIPYFFVTADDGTHGREPWRLIPGPNGGPGICDLKPGAASSNPSQVSAQGPTRADGEPYNLMSFSGDDGVSGQELHSTECDATNPPGAGSLLGDVNPGPAGSYPTQPTDVGYVGAGLAKGKTSGGFYGEDDNVSRTIAAANDGSHGRELWAYDTYYFVFSSIAVIGQDGTDHRLVADIRPGAAGSDPLSLTNVGGTLFFTADDGAHGREVWRSNGGPGNTALVADLRPGPASSAPAELTSVGSYSLYFTAVGPSGARLLYQAGTVVKSYVSINRPDSFTPPPGPVTLTASVGPGATPPAGGKVTFIVDGHAAATVPVVAAGDNQPSTATFTTTLTAGDHVFFASYSGDGHLTPSYSPPRYLTAVAPAAVAPAAG